MARPAFQPTDEQRRSVELMAAFGIPIEQMTIIIVDAQNRPIAENTLRKHFKKELETGLVKANTKIARRLFEKADAGDITAIIFWLKTRARWKESPQELHIAGAGGGPLKHQKMSDTRFRKIAKDVADEV